MNSKDLGVRKQQVPGRARPELPGDANLPVSSADGEGSSAVGGPRATAGGRAHRVTVDLDDNAYSFVRRSALDWFVPGSALLRALIAEMADDVDLAERVRIRSQQR